jgi:putative ABC transport system substrate-binding protein
MRQIGLAVVLALSISAPFDIEAQQPSRVWRIGVLSPFSPSPGSHSTFEALAQGLRELGWVDGQNIAIEYRGTEGDLTRLPDLAAELVRLKVDVIVAPTTAAALAAKNATRSMPIVMVYIADPVGAGLVASLGRPGGNITGLSWGGIELSSKQLELLKETVPRLSKLAVLTNPASQFHRQVVKDVETSARTLGLHLQILEVRGPAEFDTAFSTMRRLRADAVLIPGDPMFNFHRTRLADLAAANRLPAMYGQRDNVEAGGLMSYSPSLREAHRQAATFVDKILKGAKPADLPVEQPTKLELVINLKTAKALGLTIPQTLVLRADQLIE